jgi:uncharacterized protein YkwD
MQITRRLALVSGAGALVAACSQPSTSVRQQPPFYRDLGQPGAVIDAQTAASMISGYRRNNGLGPVIVDPRLTLAARELAYAMAQQDNVQISLRQPPLKDRLGRVGYVSNTADENVSAGYRTLAEAFSGWRESPSHNRVLKLAGATHLGIATAYAPGSKYKVSWTLIMAGGGR